MTKTMIAGMLTWMCGLFMLMALLGSTATTEAEPAATGTFTSDSPH